MSYPEPPVVGAPSSRSSRSKVVAILTVIGWNLLFVMAVWTEAAIVTRAAEARSSGGFDDLANGIIAMLGTGAILVISAICVTATIARANSDARWLPATLSTGRIMLRGTKMAAWSLLALVPVTWYFLLQ